jgi:hypothetical protein
LGPIQYTTAMDIYVNDVDFGPQHAYAKPDDYSAEHPEQPVVRPGISYASTSRSDTYGDMPLEMLTAKFDETAGGYDEYAYDTYARGTLIDRRPDAPAFEWEYPRSGVNQSYGMLQLRSNGHRGDSEIGHPEMFDGFLDADPRGVATSPDMKRVVEQSGQRGRLQFFNNDATATITGGGRNEGQVQEAKVRGYTDLRGRLKVFSRTMDGRQPATQTTHEHRSMVERASLDQSYGDKITADAIAPIKSPRWLLGKMIRNTNEYRVSTLDSDLAIAKYGRICKSGQNIPSSERPNQLSQVKLGDSDRGQARRQRVQLLSELLIHKRDLLNAPQDISFALEREGARRKTAVITGEVLRLQRAVQHQTDFAQSDQTMILQTPSQPGIVARGLDQVADHQASSHQALAAVLNYRAVREGRKPRLPTHVDVRTAPTADAAGAVRHAVNTSDNQAPWLGVSDYYTVYSDRRVAPHYKAAQRRTAPMHKTAEFANDSTKGQTGGRQQTGVARGPNPVAAANEAKFAEYATMDRRIGPATLAFSSQNTEQSHISGGPLADL